MSSWMVMEADIHGIHDSGSSSIRQITSERPIGMGVRPSGVLSVVSRFSISSINLMQSSSKNDALSLSKFCCSVCNGPADVAACECSLIVCVLPALAYKKLHLDGLIYSSMNVWGQMTAIFIQTTLLCKNQGRKNDRKWNIKWTKFHRGVPRWVKCHGLLLKVWSMTPPPSRKRENGRTKKTISTMFLVIKRS